MKNIGSRNVTGPEAILIAVVKWWLKSVPNLENSIKQELLTLDSKLITGKIDYKLGEAFFKLFPLEVMTKHFWSVTATNDITRFMIELATKSLKNQDQVNQTKELVKKFIVSEIGQIILKQRVNPIEVRTATNKKTQKKVVGKSQTQGYREVIREAASEGDSPRISSRH